MLKGCETNGVIEFILISIGIIAALLAMLNLIVRVSLYYRRRFNMSIWAGVFSLIIAGVIGTYSTIHYDKPNIGLIIVAISIAFLICVLDIRHAGIIMGTLAILFQVLMAIAFVFLCIVFLIRLFYNFVTNRQGRRIIVLSGDTDAIRLFFRFFIP